VQEEEEVAAAAEEAETEHLPVKEKYNFDSDNSGEEESPDNGGCKEGSEDKGLRQDIDAEYRKDGEKDSAFQEPELKQHRSSNASRSSLEIFWSNSKRALKKTVASFICLLIMMLISFIISEYEYKINKAINDNEFKRSFEKVNATENAERINNNVTTPKMMKDSQFNLTKLEEHTAENLFEIMNAAGLSSVDSWKSSILSSTEYGEPFLRFILTTIISLGAFLKIIYQSYGMAGLPVFLIKGSKSLEAENSEI